MNDELLGHQLGSYRLVQRLGRGAFGSVYLGKHFLLEHKPPVAIKVLNTTLRSQEELDRFFQEALLLDKLTHPSILQVIDANIYEDYPFFIAEYAPNGSLRDIMDQLDGQPMPLPDTMHVLTQVGQALQHAHDLDVIHRDLKPANILFNAQGDALLADFGISVQLHKTGRVDEIGTPVYMAPEQFKGQVSKKSDQYALACIAYELLTGQLLFDADDPYTIGYKHIYEPPLEPREINPDIPEAIEKVILKALSKDRDDRYLTVEDMILALREAAGVSDDEVAAAHYVADPARPHVFDRHSSNNSLNHLDFSGPSSKPPYVAPEEDDAGSASTPHISSGSEAPSTHHSPTHSSSGHPVSGHSSRSTIPDLSQRHVQSQPYMPASQHITRFLPGWSVTTGLDHTHYAEPAAAGGMVYVGTYTTADWNSEGHFQVHCLEGASGKLRWSFVAEHSVKAAPTVGNGIVYACSGDDDSRGKLYALNVSTGQKLWAVGTKEALHSTPILSNGSVYFHSLHGLYSVDAVSGEKHWAISVEEGIFAPPVIIDGTIYISTINGSCYGIDATSGQQLSAFNDVGNVYVSGQATEGVRCIGLYNDGLYADDADSGKTLWYSMIDKNLSGGGIIVDHQTIYVGAHGGFGESARERLFSININTGEQYWIATLKNIMVAAPVVTNGVVYVSTFGGGLYAIDATQGKILASVNIGSRGKPTRPAAANGMVFVSTGDLHAYRLE